MKIYLSFFLLLAASALWGFDCTPFGPQADYLNCAMFDDTPLCLGGLQSDHGTVFLEENGVWNDYPHFSNLPVLDVCKRGDSTLMAIMGMGSYSDGVYDLNLSTHVWTLNEWFFRPNFICRYPVNGVYYVGETDGLFKSTDGLNWTRITTLGLGECNSMAWWENHVVVNRGSAVYYSSDAAGTWNQSGMSLLEGFSFAMDGTLYGLINADSDSDGLWRSEDFGETWEVVFYTSGLCSIGPDFSSVMPLGWDRPNEHGQYLELLDQQGNLTPLSHPDLETPVRETGMFPLVNTPAFYVLNSTGCYFITGFINVETNDPSNIPSPDAIDFRVWPNPTKRSLALKFERAVPSEAKAKLYDLRGRLRSVWNLGRGENGSFRLDLPSLPAGVYLLKVDTRGVSGTQRIIIVDN